MGSGVATSTDAVTVAMWEIALYPPSSLSLVSPQLTEWGMVWSSAQLQPRIHFAWPSGLGDLGLTLDPPVSTRPGERPQG